MLEGENQLIEGAKGGDAASFGKIYDHYASPIYRFIYMKVSHRQEAEDLTHEVFMSAWQHVGSYEMQGFPFSSWLYQIARNRIIDYYRVKKTNAPLESVQEEHAQSSGSVENTLDTQLGIAHVRRAVRELTPSQQDVILLKFLSEFSHRDIATILGKSEGAIRLIQHRAIGKLKRLLKDTPDAGFVG